MIQATNFRQRVSLCIFWQRIAQNRIPQRIHVYLAVNPQTVQKWRRVVELGGPTAALK